MSRPEWEDTWLDVAQVMADRSSCVRRQVGAVIVSWDNRLISAGYNGTAPKEKNCDQGGCPRGALQGPLPEDYVTYECWALHAEANALLRAREDVQGQYLFCTHRPCPQCQNLIMGAGIYIVHWLDHEQVNGLANWMPKYGRLDELRK